jgi:hypothetical protein
MPSCFNSSPSRFIYFCVSFLSLSPSAPLFHPFHFPACHRYHSPIRCPSLMSCLVLVFVPIRTWLYLLFIPVTSHLRTRAFPSSPATSFSQAPPKCIMTTKRTCTRHASDRQWCHHARSTHPTFPDVQTSSKTLWKSSKAKRSIANRQIRSELTHSHAT